MTEQEKNAFIAFCGSLNEADKDALRPFMKDLRVSFNSLREKIDRLMKLKDLSYKLLETQHDAVLPLIDTLVRERRVQKGPAEKIRKAIRIASMDLSTAMERISHEIPKYDKYDDFVKAYVEVIDNEKRADPTLESLAKESGFSKSEWSKRLSRDPNLLMLLNRALDKKMNFAKSDQKKELWKQAADVVETRISKYADKLHRNKELTSGSMAIVEDIDGIEAIDKQIDLSLERKRRGK